MPGTWPTISRSSRPSICPSIDPSSMPSFTSSRPLPPTRSTRSSPSSTCSPAIVSKPLPEKPLIRVLVVADQLLLLGVDRDHRVPGSLKSQDPGIDVLELGIAVRVVAAFVGLEVTLATGPLGNAEGGYPRRRSRRPTVSAET